MIFRIRRALAKCREVCGLQAAGYAHFVQVCVGRKREQTGMLIFPAEARDAGLPRGFRDRDLNDLAANGAAAVLALLVGDVNDGGTRDSLYVAVAQSIQRSAKCANVGVVWRVFLDFIRRVVATRAHGAIVDQRAIRDGYTAVADSDVGVREISARIYVTDAEFRDLANAAECGSLVTFPAGLRVKERTETISRVFHFCEDAGVHTVGGAVYKAVGLIVEAGWCFARCRRRGCNHVEWTC